MDESTRSALISLNRVFYASFADDFDRTRRRWPPGLARILPHLEGASNVLDLGCGNGRLLHFLGDACWQGNYAGLDASEGLLEAARVRAAATPSIVATLRPADLTDPGWVAAVRRDLPAPDVVASLAVLHHIPGTENRAAFVRQAAGLLVPGGRLVLTTWRFMRSARLRARVVPWSVVPIDADKLEPGDYLLGWGEGNAGLRYCADIDEERLRAMGTEAGLTTLETFTADGLEGDLNLYGVFMKAAA